MLNGEIQPLGFNCRDYLPMIEIVKPEPLLTSIRVVKLVTPVHLSEFCGAPMNTVRLAFQKSGMFNYFTGGETHGVQKFICLTDANSFAAQYISTVKHKNKETIRLNRLKTVDISVTYLN